MGYWKMDDGVGNPCPSGVATACDSSGNGNVGTWTNGVASTSGKFGYAENFDGVNDYVGISDSTALKPANLTVSEWVNFGKLDSGAQHIITKWDATTGYGFSEDEVNGQLTWSVSVGSTFYHINVPSSSLSTNTWYHLVGTYDGETSVFYINGVEQGRNTTPSGSLTHATNGLYFSSDLGGSKFFPGKLDDVRIYNRALSTREITNLYDWAPGPVGWWKMDEGSGTTAIDSSGNGYCGTINNSPSWTSGKYGKGLNLNSSLSQNVDVSSIATPLADGDVSTSFWFKPNINITSSFATDMYLFGVISGPSTNDFKVYFPGGTGLLRWRINNQNADSIVTSWTAGVWHHVEATFSTTDGMKLYVDGVLVGTNSNTSRPTTIKSPTAYIGSSIGALYFNGVIDDVKVYDYARTPKQIVSDMNGGHPAVGSPVGSALVHYKFDEGNGTTTRNNGSAGSLFDATLSSFASPATFGSGWTNNGKFGKALNFDGSNDDVYTNDDIALTPPNDMSVSVWVKPTKLNGTLQQIVYKNHTADPWYSYALLIDSNNQLWFVWHNTVPTQFTVKYPGTLSINTWYHVVATRDGTSLKLYVNGKLASTLTGVTGTNYDSDNVLSIGSDTVSEVFNGTIDEFKRSCSALVA